LANFQYHKVEEEKIKIKILAGWPRRLEDWVDSVVCHLSFNAIDGGGIGGRDWEMLSLLLRESSKPYQSIWSEIVGRGCSHLTISYKILNWAQIPTRGTFRTLGQFNVFLPLLPYFNMVHSHFMLSECSMKM
jgi:hypothetical protein